MKKYFVTTLMLALSVATIVAQNPLPQEATEQEKRLGEEAVKEFESKVKVVNDHPLLPQLKQILARIATVTERPKMNYTIKVIENNEPNAFTFPGGYMYVTTGLLTRVGCRYSPRNCPQH
ncbi:MAG: M48 family metalloprotease [Armatimonadota bacterium]|nr:M48 family metalloprotease [Armatimonadota bacterium]